MGSEEGGVWLVIIMLCGSTRFWEYFEYINKELTLRGHVVISVGCYGHRDKDPRILDNKEMLVHLHKRKIDLSDAIYVINKDGYIGESTKGEIEYAIKNNKKVVYMEARGFEHR